MRKIAILEKGNVINTIVIPSGKDGDKEITARNGVEITGTKVSKGWSYDGKTFSLPPKTPEEIELIEKAEQAEAEKQAKLESAKAKLTALGLDEAEVQAILGL